MTNFILKYSGGNQPDIKKMTAVFDTHNVQIIDDSLLPKTVLVKMEESQLAHIQFDLDTDWKIYPEKDYTIPDTKKKIR